jgi:hypothetical protein
MPSIQNVRLEIVENQGAAAALVTFSLIGTSQDLAGPGIYTQIVELIGVDRAPKEDGIDEPIPGSRSETLVTFPFSPSQRKQLIALNAGSLDEDGPLFPAIALSDEDEIQARVTLSSAVSAVSNTVVLHPILVGASTPA